MRRSTLYFLIFVAVACISSAITPRLLLKETMSAEPEISDFGDQKISAIDCRAKGYLYILTDTMASSSYVSGIDPDLVSLDPSTGILTILAPDKGKTLSVEVHLLPSDTILAINLASTGQSLELEGLSTPVMALSAQPDNMTIMDCNIGLLSTGNAGDSDDVKTPHITFIRSTVDLFTTLVSDTDLSYDINRSTVGTLR